MCAAQTNGGSAVGRRIDAARAAERWALVDGHEVVGARRGGQDRERKEKVNSMLEVVAAACDGDLTREMTVTGDDAAGQVAAGITRLPERLRNNIAGITKALANEWSRERINVNAIAPGYIATSNTAALQADESRNRPILDRIPAGRWGRPDDLCGAAGVLPPAGASPPVSLSPVHAWTRVAGAAMSRPC